LETILHRLGTGSLGRILERFIGKRPVKL